MNVGLTYDLRSDYLAMGYSADETAEFDSEETVAAIEGTIRELGHTVVRVGNIKHLVAALARGDTWDVVFNICEGFRGYGREAQVPALLEAWRIPYTFADPLCACLTLHKGMAKRVLRDCGVPTSDFRLVERLADVDAVDLPFPLFVKPVAEGTGKGVLATSRVDDRAGLLRECQRVIDTYHQAAIVEPFLSGREFTTGITGSGDTAVAVGTVEVILRSDKAEAHAYTYTNKVESDDRCFLPMADPEWHARCAVVALAAWRALGCRDAGRVDLRADADGQLQVLEANPLPGMRPNYSDLPILCANSGVPFPELIRRILDGAIGRAGRA